MFTPSDSETVTCVAPFLFSSGARVRVALPPSCVTTGFGSRSVLAETACTVSAAPSGSLMAKVSSLVVSSSIVCALIAASDGYKLTSAVVVAVLPALSVVSTV